MVDIRGFFEEPAASDPDTQIVPRPFIQVFVANASAGKPINFLLGTGADATIISPRDAFDIWGESYLNWDFGADRRGLQVQGVGSGVARFIERRLTVNFASRDDLAQQLSFLADIWLAEPDAYDVSAPTNWNLPSLLGRDLMQLFTVRLAYVPEPDVMLSFPDSTLLE